MSRPPPGRRDEYFWFCAITPRWNDNDVFGHVNNAEFYGFFDTALMRFLVGADALTISGGDTGMVVAESGCTFYGEVVFTDTLQVGLRAAHIGNSSVRYQFGLFVNDTDTASAEGHVTHVCINRASKRPKPIADAHRAALNKITKH
jgi:acyl-CoA thioester hydrolase